MKERPWHMHFRAFGCSRAFAKPSGSLSALAMYLRGWRPFHLGGWWSKPSRALARAEAKALA